MAQPTLPNFADICLQTIIENWQNYNTVPLQNARAYFKLITLDKNTIYCLESPIFTQSDISSIVTLGVFDSGISYIGNIVVLPTDTALVGNASIDGVAYRFPANSKPFTVPGFFSALDSAINLTNCTVYFASGVALMTKE